jgi:hypothetical protein
MCVNAFTALFCCPCMVVYWIFANVCGVILSLLKYACNCMSCYEVDESGDSLEGGIYNPLAPGY